MIAPDMLNVISAQLYDKHERDTGQMSLHRDIKNQICNFSDLVYFGPHFSSAVNGFGLIRVSFIPIGFVPVGPLSRSAENEFAFCSISLGLVGPYSGFSIDVPFFIGL
jgi:hypothetical protein